MFPHSVLRAAACLGLVVACRPAPTQTPDPLPAGRWAYDVRVRDGAARLDVTLCWGGPRADLVTPDRSGSDHVIGLRNARTGQPLRRLGDRWQTTGLRADDCVAYTVDLFEMARREGLSRVVRWVGDSVMVRQSMWLLRPLDVEPDAVQLELSLPDDVEASVPWPRTDGRALSANHRAYSVDATALQWLGYTAFGRLDVQRFASHGTALELVALDGRRATDDAGLRRWIGDALGTTALLYGAFPRDRLQVIVVPVAGGGEGTVYFGMAGRGGGPGVLLLLDEDAPAAALPGGWTTVHEHLHHGMPFVEDPWMAEGWVSYYTELLRTRIGHRSEAEGWQALWEAFARGDRTRRGGTLRAHSDRMHETFAYMRVYWGGAAIAFFIDLALREDSGDTVTLDDAMRELRRCCGDAPHTWTADELLAQLDTWYGTPLFSTIAAQHLDAEGFPDVGAAFDRLGLSRADGKVIVDDAHPAASTRRRIMLGGRPRSPPPRRKEAGRGEHAVDPVLRHDPS
jgi:hypothetical protein